jgi:hypothetical protein
MRRLPDGPGRAGGGHRTRTSSSMSIDTHKIVDRLVQNMVDALAVMLGW